MPYKSLTLFCRNNLGRVDLACSAPQRDANQRIEPYKKKQQLMVMIEDELSGIYRKPRDLSISTLLK